MIDRLVEAAVRNRLLVVLALIAGIVASALALPRLKLDAFPDVTNVQVVVNTEAPGLAATEVEQLISFPVEAVMYALPNVAEVRSISKTGLSIVSVVFDEGTDLYFARQLVFERLQQAKDRIPPGVGTPQMGPNSSGLGQVFQYLLRTDDPSRFDPMTMRGLNDWLVKLLLMPVDGVTDVLSFGGEVRQFQVLVDPQRLLSYGLRVQDLAAAIEANNRNAGGWYLDRGPEQLTIRGVGWVRPGEEGLRDIANIPLKDAEGIPVQVRDVAEVAFGPEIRQGAVTMTLRDVEGQPRALGEVIAGIVLKRMGANTKTTIDGIHARLPAIQRALPKGVVIEPFYDQSDLVDRAVATVVRALAQAFVLIVVVLTLFLLNIRATLLVLISIPLSIGFALTTMAAANFSANLMSLGGLAIAIGMIVDGSVVMMDHIFTHLSRSGGAGGTALRIEEAAREVGRPVFFAVGVVLIVFAPLFALQGVEGKLFQPMAVAIVLAMLASALVALLVVPALASFVFHRPVTPRTSPLLKPLAWGYHRLLRAAMRLRWLVIALAMALLAGTLWLIPRLGTEFVPELEEGTLNIRVTLAPSASLDTALTVAAKLEPILLGFPEVTYASSRIGRAEIGGDPEPVSNIEIYVGLKPQAEWTNAATRGELQERMEQALSVHPGLLFSFSQPIATRVDELLSGVKAELAIKLFGPDLEGLAKYGKVIESIVQSVPGTRDVALEPVEGESQLTIRPDRDRLARFGIPVAQVMDLVKDAIGGTEAGQVIHGNERYDILVRLAPAYRGSVEAIGDLILVAAKGAQVRLRDLAEVRIGSGPPQIRRDDVQRRVVIEANVMGRDMGSLVAEIDRRIATEVDLPPGYAVVFGGQYENQQHAQQRLMIVVPVSLGLIFLLLYFAFHSVGEALLVMLNVPLALIGGVGALWLSGQYLSVPSSIGFIAVFGTAVLNGVVMVNAIDQNLEGGLGLRQAIEEGALSRLRPVLMTALTTLFGLIPLLFATGVGAEVQRPLATVVIGGLVSSTLLTLFVLPVLYRSFSRFVAPGANRPKQIEKCMT